MPSRIIFLQNMLAQKLCQRAGISTLNSSYHREMFFDDWTILVREFHCPNAAEGTRLRNSKMSSIMSGWSRA